MRRRILALHAEGHTITKVAELAGTSREWANITVREHGTPRSREQQREVEFRLRVGKREDAIEALFWEHRDFDRTAAAAGVLEADVRRIVESRWADADVFCVRSPSERRFTDEALLAALREAARVVDAVTGEEYDRWARSEVGRPSRGTILVRFKGWNTALRRAGIEPGRARRGPGRYSEDVCREAVARCWRELGAAPSPAQFRTWQAGRVDVPGADMVRQRLGRWQEALLMAYPLAHGRFPDALVAASAETFGATDVTVARAVGRAYRPRDLDAWRRSTSIAFADGSAAERAYREHFAIESALADGVRAAGFEPCSPSADDPEFDLAWWDGATWNVAEVKSVTEVNERTQLGHGLLQVLSYTAAIRARGARATPVLVGEREPAPLVRTAIEDAGVRLFTWPDCDGLFAAATGAQS